MTKEQSVPSTATAAPIVNEHENAGPARLIDKANDIGDFASCGDSRPALEGVFMGPRGTVATDGRVVIEVPYVTIPASEFPEGVKTPNILEPVTVPVKPLREALKNAPKNMALPVLNTVKVSNKGKVYMATSDLDSDRVVASKPVEYNFPNYRQFFPDDTGVTVRICLSSKYLSMIADYAIKNRKPGENPPGVTFTFKSDRDAVRFSIPVADGRTAEGVLMPMTAPRA